MPTNIDYNTLVSNQYSTLEQYGIGKKEHGLGQNTSEIYQIIPDRTVLTTANWNTVFSAINACLLHQGEPVVNPAAITNLSQLTGSIYTAYLEGATTAYQNSGKTSQPLIDQAYSTSTTLTWKGAGSSVTFNQSLTFNSGDAARYFFNAGGKINLVLSTSNNTYWENLCNTIGTITFDYKNTITPNNGGSVYILRNQDNGGYWSGTETYETHFQQYNVASGHTEDFVKIEFCWSGTPARGGYPTLNFRTTLYNTSGEDVTGLTTLSVMAKLPSSTYILNTWGLPIFAGTVTVESDLISSIWGWGINTEGQLGTGDTVRYLDPQQINGSPSWLDISSGVHHTVAIDASGTLWVWGKNNFGQLGLGSTGLDVVTPTQITG